MIWFTLYIYVFLFFCWNHYFNQVNSKYLYFVKYLNYMITFLIEKYLAIGVNIYFNMKNASQVLL